MPFYLMSGVGGVLVYPRPKGHGHAGTAGVRMGRMYVAFASFAYYKYTHIPSYTHQVHNI